MCIFQIPNKKQQPSHSYIDFFDLLDLSLQSHWCENLCCFIQLSISFLYHVQNVRRLFLWTNILSVYFWTKKNVVNMYKNVYALILLLSTRVAWIVQPKLSVNDMTDTFSFFSSINPISNHTSSAVSLFSTAGFITNVLYHWHVDIKHFWIVYRWQHEVWIL